MVWLDCVSEMKIDELKRLYPNASASFLKRNQASGASSNTRIKQAPRDEPVAKVSGTQGNSPRRTVRITSYRTRLLDADGLCGKYFVDCLRYAGVIVDDTSALLDYGIRQEKVRTRIEEFTVIEIT